MADFVKDIISEVLSGQPAATPYNDGASVPRPNYQRMQSQKRLLTFDLTPQTSQRDGITTIPSPLGGPAPEVPDNAAALRIAGLNGFSSAGGAATAHNSTGGGFTPLSGEKQFYAAVEQTDRRVLRMAGLNASEGSGMGLVYSEKSTLPQLFAADKAVTQVPSLLPQVTWDEEDSSFFFRFAGRAEDVKKALDIFKQAVQDAPFVCSTDSAGTILRRRLKITGGFVAGLDGIPLAKLLPLADAYYKQNPESTLEFMPGKNHLLVFGQPEEALGALQQFLQQAGR